MTRRQWTVLAAAGVAALVGAAIFVMQRSDGVADPDDTAQVARGRSVYAAHCARCHGDQLQGQPNWRERQPNGRLPAPPHDASGHTWHHPDQVLFSITKHGVKPPYAPEGYESDMPGFAGVLGDSDILAVIAYLKSTWPPDIRNRQRALTQQAR